MLISDGLVNEEALVPDKESENRPDAASVVRLSRVMLVEHLHELFRVEELRGVIAREVAFHDVVVLLFAEPVSYRDREAHLLAVRPLVGESLVRRLAEDVFRVLSVDLVLVRYLLRLLHDHPVEERDAQLKRARHGHLVRLEKDIPGEPEIHVEVLLLRRLSTTDWECLVKPGKKLRNGARVEFGEGLLKGEIIDTIDDGNRIIRFEFEGIWEEVLDRLGEMPIPPYIHHQLKEKARYNTVYAKNDGSAAAPTAGLHWTEELLQAVKEKGVEIAHITLHVGLGTFRPVKADKIEEHHMHSEYYIVEQSEADKINRAHAEGHRVICTGTTSCRTVEAAALPDGTMPATSGWTDIFIYPGYQFKCMDALITNFHLPESTLVMLVSAFTKREHVLRAYKVAVREKYRFFSFGDACFFADLKNDAALPAELDPNRNHEFTFLPEDAVAEVEGIPGKSYSWPLAADETPLWKTAENAEDTEPVTDAGKNAENVSGAVKDDMPATTDAERPEEGAR